MTPIERAFHVAANVLEAMVNQDERPFNAQERADLNHALGHLRKHMAHLSLMTNAILGAATLAGFMMGMVFAKLVL